MTTDFVSVEQRSHMDVDSLIAAAREATDRAIVPYSAYPVGAAIATPTDTYRGCNIEVANYSNSIHAEALALARALYAGERTFEALAVSTAARDGAPPCGTCRETLREFCPPTMPVYLDTGNGYETYTLAELLPVAFDPDDLDRHSR